jgi:AcrR family transcriptional regulator
MSEARPGATRTYDATRRRAAADVRRERVVEAAIELFQERGWSGTRLVDVAAEAGVSTELVAKAFNGKPGLFLAAFRGRSFGEHATLREAYDALRLAEVPDQHDRLEVLGDFVVQAVGPMAKLLAVMEVASDQDPDLRAILDRARAGHVAICGELSEAVAGRPCPREVVDEVVLLTRAETWSTMVGELGWTPEQFRAWLIGRLGQLLTD